MIKYYKCIFNTDTILSSSSATQGESKPLDYIPGAKFLGVVANELYDDSDKQTLDLFHNAKVQFGDAHLEYDGYRTLQIPFMWQYPKLKGIGDEIYLDYKLDDDFRKKIISKGIQLKQARNGFFDIKSEKIINIDYDFSLKSSYDIDLKKSMDGNMYGYFGVRKGTSWIFYINYQDDQYVDIVEKAIVGDKKIGRSKSAQYGQVEIKPIIDYKEHNYLSDIKIESEYLVYAESNLCFYNKINQNTLMPSAKDLGIDNGLIDWSKSQVRSRLYQTWNGYRHNRDADRWIIEKGSVFYINSGEINNDVVENGVGSHLAEGFGKVLINPSFLLSNDNKLPGKYEVIDKLKKQYIPKLEIKNSSYDVFMNLLKKKKAINDSESDINKTVNEFIKDNENKFNKVTNSQWGQVRTYAKYAQNYLTLKALLFDDPGGFMFHGQTEEIWSKGREVFKEKVESFFNDTEKIDFTIKLASQMAKTNGGNK